jgi:hypothetical protein
MKSKSFSLDVIDVASPCEAPWEAMRGDAKVRFCADCKLNVYNLSEMSRGEATQLVQQNEGRLCVRFYRRSDGTVLTRDCPVGLRAIRRRVARSLTAIAALGVFLCGGWLMARPKTNNAGCTGNSPISKLAEWIEPVDSVVVGAVWEGEMTLLPVPPNGNVPDETVDE